jgi:hypothetical protein
MPLLARWSNLDTTFNVRLSRRSYFIFTRLNLRRVDGPAPRLLKLSPEIVSVSPPRSRFTQHTSCLCNSVRAKWNSEILKDHINISSFHASHL